MFHLVFLYQEAHWIDDWSSLHTEVDDMVDSEFNPSLGIVTKATAMIDNGKINFFICEIHQVSELLK